MDFSQMLFTALAILGSAAALCIIIGVVIGWKSEENGGIAEKGVLPCERAVRTGIVARIVDRIETKYRSHGTTLGISSEETGECLVVKLRQGSRRYRSFEFTIKGIGPRVEKCWEKIHLRSGAIDGTIVVESGRAPQLVVNCATSHDETVPRRLVCDLIIMILSELSNQEYTYEIKLGTREFSRQAMTFSMLPEAWSGEK